MKKSALLTTVLLFTILIFGCSSDDSNEAPTNTVTDIDGNVYITIELGNQTWMIENLKTTTYNDGTSINEYQFGDDWYNGNNPIDYYQWADTSDLNNLYDEELPFDFFGAMYNEVALNSGKLAPIGWRIPSVADFMELEAFLSSEVYLNSEAIVLKSTEGWATNNNGTDLLGFRGLPNGYVSSFGGATGAQVICSWATSNVNTNEQTRSIVSLFDEPTITYFDNGISLGAGVRCIKNN